MVRTQAFAILLLAIGGSNAAPLPADGTTNEADTNAIPLDLTNTYIESRDASTRESLLDKALGLVNLEKRQFGFAPPPGFPGSPPFPKFPLGPSRGGDRDEEEDEPSPNPWARPKNGGNRPPPPDRPDKPGGFSSNNPWADQVAPPRGKDPGGLNGSPGSSSPAPSPKGKDPGSWSSRSSFGPPSRSSPGPWSRSSSPAITTASSTTSIELPPETITTTITISTSRSRRPNTSPSRSSSQSSRPQESAWQTNPAQTDLSQTSTIPTWSPSSASSQQPAQATASFPSSGTARSQPTPSREAGSPGSVWPRPSATTGAWEPSSLPAGSSSLSVVSSASISPLESSSQSRTRTKTKTSSFGTESWSQVEPGVFVPPKPTSQASPTPNTIPSPQTWPVPTPASGTWATNNEPMETITITISGGRPPPRPTPSSTTTSFVTNKVPGQTQASSPSDRRTEPLVTASIISIGPDGFQTVVISLGGQTTITLTGAIGGRTTLSEVQTRSTIPPRASANPRPSPRPTAEGLSGSRLTSPPEASRTSSLSSGASAYPTRTLPTIVTLPDSFSTSTDISSPVLATPGSKSTRTGATTITPSYPTNSNAATSVATSLSLPTIVTLPEPKSQSSSNSPLATLGIPPANPSSTTTLVSVVSVTPVPITGSSAAAGMPAWTTSFGEPAFGSRSSSRSVASANSPSPLAGDPYGPTRGSAYQLQTRTTTVTTTFPKTTSSSASSASSESLYQGLGGDNTPTAKPSFPSTQIPIPVSPSTSSADGVYQGLGGEATPAGAKPRVTGTPIPLSRPTAGPWEAGWTNPWTVPTPSTAAVQVPVPTSATNVINSEVSDAQYPRPSGPAAQVNPGRARPPPVASGSPSSASGANLFVPLKPGKAQPPPPHVFPNAPYIYDPIFRWQDEDD